jgi:Uncharacterized protein conserved in archaea (DUF2226)
MEMPITKPSMVAYADELEFSKLLNDISKTKKNCFMRVTSGSEDGYLLFKDGKQVAASYDNLSKLEAIDKIKLAMEDYKTLVEIFDIRPAQVSYLMDLNKPYLLEKVPEIDEVLGELKKDRENELTKNESSTEPEDTPLKNESEELAPETKERDKKTSEDTETRGSSEDASVEASKTDSTEQVVTAEASPETIPTEEVPLENETSLRDSDKKVEESPISPSDTNVTPEKVESTSDLVETPADTLETSPGTVTETPVPEKAADVSTGSEDLKPTGTTDLDGDSNSTPPEEANPGETVVEDSSETEQEEPVDRLELLKKYGIKDIDDEDVENILDSYTGGYLSDNDVEKVELTLMNRVKKSIMGLPKVKGTEVMIFLDNAGNDLKGNVNVIMEYQSQGFLSRFVGGSKEINNLKRQVIGICHMEIRKIFREYPEVVDKFEINVEVS